VSDGPITSFRGEFRFLSNFYPSRIQMGVLVYPTVEHAFQAAKCRSVGDRQRIAEAPTPGAAKRMGRRVQLRPDWEQVKFKAMAWCLHEKFTRHDDLRMRLLSTGDRELVEGNTWGDRCWGQCPVGVGENMLGKLLMSLRRELRGNRAAVEESA
jgi:ribA/ribD-fused uncharacterized protein